MFVTATVYVPAASCVNVVVVEMERSKPPGPETITFPAAPVGRPPMVTTSDPYCAGCGPGSDGESPEQAATNTAAAANPVRSDFPYMESNLLVDITAPELQR